MKGKKSNAAPAEYSMALHVLSSGLRPLSWSDAKAGLLDVRHQVRRDVGEICARS